MSKSGPDQTLAVAIDKLRAEIAALRRSRRRLVEAEVADRQALERSLHDGLQQRLVALAVDLQHLTRIVDREPAAAEASLEETAISLREALNEAAAFAQTVFPPYLAGQGLAPLLRSAAAAAGVVAAVEAPDRADYPAEIVAAIYWSWTDSLASAPSRSAVSIRVGAEDDFVIFDIGVARQPPTAVVERLRDRIEALDGRLSVDEAGRGSRLQGWLPLSR